ncbi:MAG: hypothetical protein IJT21_09065 [Synergistaceae bacterium]|nr:hypothetical protein [Synergistaceae bacterium]
MRDSWAGRGARGNGLWGFPLTQAINFLYIQQLIYQGHNDFILRNHSM